MSSNCLDSQSYPSHKIWLKFQVIKRATRDAPQFNLRRATSCDSHYFSDRNVFLGASLVSPPKLSILVCSPVVESTGKQLLVAVRCWLGANLSNVSNEGEGYSTHAENKCSSIGSSQRTRRRWYRQSHNYIHTGLVGQEASVEGLSTLGACRTSSSVMLLTTGGGCGRTKETHSRPSRVGDAQLSEKQAPAKGMLANIGVERHLLGQLPPVSWSGGRWRGGWRLIYGRFRPASCASGCASQPRCARKLLPTLVHRFARDTCSMLLRNCCEI